MYDVESIITPVSPRRGEDNPRRSRRSKYYRAEDEEHPDALLHQPRVPPWGFGDEPAHEVSYRASCSRKRACASQRTTGNRDIEVTDNPAGA